MRKLAKLAEIPADRGLQVELDGQKVLLVRDGEAVRAFAGTCPHAGANLADGAVIDGRIVCPWHKAMFCGSSGALLEPPSLEPLARFEVTVDGEDVAVGARLQADAQAAPEETPVVLVIGAGAAGVAAAAALRDYGFRGRVVLIGRELDLPYDRTALSKFVLSREMPVTEVPPVLSAAALEARGIERIVRAVTALDPASRRVHLSDHSSFAYDEALIATGAAPMRPDLPGNDLPGVFTLREPLDASAILSWLRPGAEVVILGGSFIALEAASALRKAGSPVTVAMPEPLPFARQMGDRLGARMRQLHEQNGVVFRTGTKAARLEQRGRGARVHFEDGSSATADLVLIGTGVRPETRFLAGVALTEDGGIPVDGRMQAGPHLWAAGDAARFPLAGAERLRIEHWRVAQQTARVAAANIAGADVQYEGVPFFWTYHFGKRFDYFGHPAQWDRELIDGDLAELRFVALLIAADQVVGAVACDRERAMAKLLARVKHGLDVAAAREILVRD